MKGCTGPCQQGKLECPTKSACLLPESELDTVAEVWKAVLIGALCVLALLAAVSPAFV